MEDARRWAEMYRQRMSIVKIAKAERVSPSAVGKWIKRTGIELKQGSHFVTQPGLLGDERLASIALQGPGKIAELLKQRVWGIRFSEDGLSRLSKFCDFHVLYKAGLGVEEIATKLGVHRSSVAEWRNGTDSPYLAKIALEAVRNVPPPRLMLLPLSLSSGGNIVQGWTLAPQTITRYEDVTKVIEQLTPLDTAMRRASQFGLKVSQILNIRSELFAYLLGFLVGDASKLGEGNLRFESMSIDLQLTKKHLTNLQLGEYVSMCANALGIRMNRVSDKQPTGRTALGKNPTPAFRWGSERTPLVAWMLRVCVGIEEGELTTLNQVKMNWIFEMPRQFKIRFVQGMADSDGCVKRSEVIISSVPNAVFVADLLRNLGMTTAHPIKEKGKFLSTMVNRKEAQTLPIFNEHVRGYRYGQLFHPVRAQKTDDYRENG